MREDISVLYISSINLVDVGIVMNQFGESIYILEAAL